MINLWLDQIESPLGLLLVVVEGDRLCALDYAGYEARLHHLLRARYHEFALEPTVDPAGVRRPLQAYFAGEFAALDDLPVTTGGTAFQARVWAALRTIAPGTVLTYGELAAQLGQPTAARAVGITNSLNPIAIVVPCHRVVGAQANLTGYAGGIDRKRWLLQHEQADLARLARPRRRQPAAPSFVQGSLLA